MATSVLIPCALLRSTHQHLCQVLLPQTTEGGCHWRKEGKGGGENGGEMSKHYNTQGDSWAMFSGMFVKFGSKWIPWKLKWSADDLLWFCSRIDEKKCPMYSSRLLLPWVTLRGAEWLISSSKEIMFSTTFVSVCLSICLFICEQDNWKSTVGILMKFLDNVGVRTRSKLLNFGGDS